jgi:hypothetical protein
MRKDDLPKRRTTAKFEHIGDKAAGEIMPPGPQWQDDKFNAGDRVLVLILNDGDYEVQLYARRRQQEAIHEALDLAEADAISTGGWLELVYAADVETANGTGKRWDATYVPAGQLGDAGLFDAG